MEEVTSTSRSDDVYSEHFNSSIHSLGGRSDASLRGNVARFNSVIHLD
jgi:hypothetical protein